MLRGTLVGPATLLYAFNSTAIPASPPNTFLRWRTPLAFLQVKRALAKSPDSIRFVDASWHLGGTRNAKEEFKEGHLPGGVFFDIDSIADQAASLPHM